MSGFVFPHIRFEEPEDLLSGHWLWIWNADKIPPHVGLSHNERYFSLTWKDCELALPVSGRKQQADRAGIPLVLIKLGETINFRDPRKVFSAYTSAVKDKTTCLRPVVEALGLNESIPQLSELLKLLAKQDNLRDVFALHLNKDYTKIAAYSVSDITRRIGQLHEADRRKDQAEAG
jgi:hypothetical protein